MAITMRTVSRIIPIGDSQGVLIPRLLLQQSGLGEDVELEADSHQIIIRAPGQPRQGWDEAFKTMSARGDDQLLDEDLTGQTEWDQEEWEW